MVSTNPSSSSSNVVANVRGKRVLVLERLHLVFQCEISVSGVSVVVVVVVCEVQIESNSEPGSLWQYK